jgi:hypothetical protein
VKTITDLDLYDFQKVIGEGKQKQTKSKKGGKESLPGIVAA